MLKSYVGIASCDGLERLCPEYPNATRFLFRHAGRLRSRRAVCLWAVISDEAADVVLAELRRGGKQAAYDLLRAEARQMGPITHLRDGGLGA